MTSSKDLLHEFVESVRGKDCSEVIILADREATPGLSKFDVRL